LQDLKISFPVKKNNAIQTNPFTKKNKKPAMPKRLSHAVIDFFFFSSIAGCTMQISGYDVHAYA
jgi:hypothetical protein